MGTSALARLRRVCIGAFLSLLSCCPSWKGDSQQERPLTRELPEKQLFSLWKLGLHTGNSEELVASH